MPSGLLAQIANPMVADIPGAFDRGRQMTQQQQLGGLQQAALKQQMGYAGAKEGRAVSQEQRLGAQEQRLGAQEQRTQTEFGQEQDKRVASELAYDLLSAFSIGPGNNRDKILKNATAKAPDGIMKTTIESLDAMPEGKEKEKRFIIMIKAAQQQGLLPKPSAPTKTAEQIQQEIDIKAKQADTSRIAAGTGIAAQRTREAELVARIEEGKRTAGTLKPTMQKILDTSQTTAFESQKTANSFDLLTRDFDKLGFGGGVKSSISEFLKDTLGTPDDVSALRRKFRGIRASQATKNLPPGAASDKDIELALSGFPPDNAPARSISSFLKGASKIAKIDQAFNEYKAEYISDNKSTAGLIKSWKENKTRVVSDAVADFEAGKPDQSVIVMRHPTKGDITEGDIAVTMQNNGMTRDEVLTRLGGTQ